jgi:predicted RNA-binding protein YlxR (DUF448 family)
MSSDQLVRVAIGGPGLVLDRRAPGRGAWLCPRLECFEAARRARAFGRALRADVEPEWVDGLRGSFETENPNVRG